MPPLTKPIRIVIADDHPFFRAGFKYILQAQSSSSIELMDEAENGTQLLQLVKKYHPDVVVTDIRMPEMDGIEACKQIRKKFPTTGVVALSVSNEERLVYEMLDAGANGYLLKSVAVTEVVAAIRQVSSGENYYCTSTTNKLCSLVSRAGQRLSLKKDVALSAQELRITKLICAQFTTKEIADKLSLSPRTIEDYRHHIQEKMNARNVAGIVLFAVMHGIIQLGEL